MKIWKKVVAAMTAGMLCLGSVGLSGVENVLKSVGTVLSASAEETAETERVPVGTGTTTFVWELERHNWNMKCITMIQLGSQIVITTQLES